MSQQSEGNTEKPQQNVRVVPIFVEGRDAPVINKDFPDTSGPQQQQQHHHHVPEPPRMSSNIDFGADMPPFSQGSIFERAKNIPVRSTMKDHFKDLFRDSESPIRNIPVNHMHPEAKVHKRHASPQPQQVPHERARTFSGGAPQPQQQQSERPKAAPQAQQQQQPERPKATPQAQQQQQQQQQPKKEQTPPPPVAKPPPVDAITKIQQIQKDVLDLMVKVEHFEGKTKKDKEYLYLDEMLTQNLLKLDTVDTDGKENVKLARKEAVKCINRCLNVLEAKAEAAAAASKEQPNNTQAAASGEQSQTAVPAEPSKTSSRSSVYDNHEDGVEQPSSEAAAESPPAQQVDSVATASQPAA